VASTRALASNDAGDATYTSIEGQIQSLTSQRDALAAQILAVLEALNITAGFSDAQAQQLIAQAQNLLNQASQLAARSSAEL